MDEDTKTVTTPSEVEKSREIHETQERTRKVKFDLACPGCKAAYSLHHEGSMPMVLQCCHSLCNKCCHTLADTDSLTHPEGDINIVCPTCDYVTEIDLKVGMQILKNHLHFPLHNELKRIEKENYKVGGILCDNCDKSAKANWRCLQCTSGCSNLCDDCKSQHNSLKALRSHDVVTMTDFSKSSDFCDISVPTICSVHKEPIEKFCKDCMEAVCGSCVMYQHQSHSCTSVAEGAETETADLVLHIESVTGRTREFVSEIDRVKEIKETLCAQKESLKDQIVSSFADLREILRIREEEVMKQLAFRSNFKDELIQKQISFLEQEVAQVDFAVDYAKQTTACSSEQVILSSPWTRRRLIELKFSQLATIPCQQADLKSEFKHFKELKQSISMLGEVTGDTLPSPEHSALEQKSFRLIESEEGKLWEVVCAFVVCNAHGTPISLTTGAVPDVVLTRTPLPSDQNKGKYDIAEDQPSEVVVGDTEFDDNSSYTMSFANGVWVIVITTTTLSALSVSVSLVGSEIKNSPLIIRRGKPEICFGNDVGTISSHSNLNPGFLSSMSIENLRIMEGKPCVWKRDKTPYDFFESNVVLELAPNCLLSHIILKNAESDQYKLFYRSSRSVESDSETCLAEDEKEPDDSEFESKNDWNLLEFLTPDWTDVKENKTLIVDISEEECKTMGYVNAIRLELKAKNKANSFHGIHIYGWNVGE